MLREKLIAPEVALVLGKDEGEDEGVMGGLSPAIAVLSDFRHSPQGDTLVVLGLPTTLWRLAVVGENVDAAILAPNPVSLGILGLDGAMNQILEVLVSERIEQPLDAALGSVKAIRRSYVASLARLRSAPSVVDPKVELAPELAPAADCADSA